MSNKQNDRSWQLWSDEEDEKVAYMLSHGYTVKEVAVDIGRTSQAIYNRINSLKSLKRY